MSKDLSESREDAKNNLEKNVAYSWRLCVRFYLKLFCP